MRKVFYIAVISFIFFECLKRYLVMNLPGSLEIANIDFAMNLQHYRRYIELFFGLLIVYSAWFVFKEKNKTIPSILILLAVLFFWLTNYYFIADSLFLQPKLLIFESAEKNKVPEKSMVIGITYNGYSKAYPTTFVLYHHQIIDSIGDKKIMITYCGLCRTGRVFEPFVDGVYTSFRLVGVHHSNAVFEDDKTKSWWSQETGKCIAGPQKGKYLPEYMSYSMTLKTWLSLYPTSTVMQADPSFAKRYNNGDYYEVSPENSITQSFHGNWNKNTFVLGFSKGNDALAIQWNHLLADQLIQARLGDKAFVLALSSDNESFVAFENPLNKKATLNNDTLFIQDIPYALNGKSYHEHIADLKPISVYREFWFSWLYAHPTTKKWSPQ
jgi:hypothetical protein